MLIQNNKVHTGNICIELFRRHLIEKCLIDFVEATQHDHFCQKNEKGRRFLKGNSKVVRCCRQYGLKSGFQFIFYRFLMVYQMHYSISNADVNRKEKASLCAINAQVHHSTAGTKTLLSAPADYFNRGLDVGTTDQKFQYCLINSNKHTECVFPRPHRTDLKPSNNNDISRSKADILDELVQYGLLQDEAEYLVNFLNGIVEAASDLLHKEIGLWSEAVASHHRSTCNSICDMRMYSQQDCKEHHGVTQFPGNLQLLCEWWIQHEDVHHQQMVYLEKSTTMNQVRSVTSKELLYTYALNCNVLGPHIFAHEDVDDFMNSDAKRCICDGMSIEPQSLYDIYPMKVEIHTDASSVGSIAHRNLNPGSHCQSNACPYKYHISGETLLKLMRMYLHTVTKGGQIDWGKCVNRMGLGAWSMAGMDVDSDSIGSVNPNCETDREGAVFSRRLKQTNALILNQHWLRLVYCLLCRYEAMASVTQPADIPREEHNFGVGKTSEPKAVVRVDNRPTGEADSKYTDPIASCCEKKNEPAQVEFQELKSGCGLSPGSACGHQMSLPRAVFAWLVDKLHVRHECFASSLNCFWMLHANSESGPTANIDCASAVLCRLNGACSQLESNGEVETEPMVKFYSGHHDIDQWFGSSGSFFDLYVDEIATMKEGSQSRNTFELLSRKESCGRKRSLEIAAEDDRVCSRKKTTAARPNCQSVTSIGTVAAGGSFQVNPPYVDAFMTRVALHVIDILTVFEAAASPPFSFVVVLPAWRGADSIEMLKESIFCRHMMLLARYAHSFVAGTHHRAEQANEAKGHAVVCKSNIDCFVFILQNASGASKWPMTDALCSELQVLMEQAC